MPLVLEVSLLPRDLLIPDILDVVLYFFPCEEDERSTKNFSSLFELLETEKSVMRGRVGDMELLIFTSKQLPPDCQEEAESSIREQFLWGIIRRQNNSCTSLNLSSSVDTEVSNAGGSDADLDRENRTNNAQVTEDE